MSHTSPQLESLLVAMVSQGLIVTRTENNRYLKLSYKGAGGLVSPKWNIKIYTSGSVVCTDGVIIEDFSNGKLKPPDTSLKLIQIDDSGWGFPLFGSMIGFCCDNRVVTDMVDVSFFKPGSFDRQEYLQEYANKGLAILHSFGATPETHRIEICTGYINKKLRDVLRTMNYDVRTVEIKGLLQDSLERLFKEYVIKETKGIDLAYDPKECSKKDISFNYRRALEWGKKYAPHLLKSGWRALREPNNYTI